MFMALDPSGKRQAGSRCEPQESLSPAAIRRSLLQLVQLLPAICFVFKPAWQNPHTSQDKEQSVI